MAVLALYLTKKDCFIPQALIVKLTRFDAISALLFESTRAFFDVRYERIDYTLQHTPYSIHYLQYFNSKPNKVSTKLLNQQKLSILNKFSDFQLI